MKGTVSKALDKALASLESRRYFKLICGGSFTDPEKVAALVRLYTQAGVDCIDMAPEPQLLGVLEDVFAQLDPNYHRPLIMVSLPLDPDPHFRKIDLIESDCITCNLCIPVCPTEALAEGNPQEQTKLLIQEPLCYGCGRCVDLCPTQALVLHPIYEDAGFNPLLAHPLVEAVEIHTRYADPYMLEDFLNRFGDALADKLLSVCFRPEGIPTTQWLVFLERLQQATCHPLLIQVDGQPMSGSDDPEASLPALKAAKLVYEGCGTRFPYITISGGINQQTAEYLRDPEYAFISGVGMGTVARKLVWPVLNAPEGTSVASHLVAIFHNHPTA